MLEIIFLILGFILGLVGNLIIIYLQFKRSTAGYRLKHIIEATKTRLHRVPNTGATRKQYWYSLGVFIDDFQDMDSRGIKQSTGKWALLADDPNDAWGRYEKWVRPVINDINAYIFLGAFRGLRRDLRQLDSLAALCIAMEIVVSAVAAGLEKDSSAVVAIQGEGIVRRTENLLDSRVKAIENAYENLYIAWQNWC